VLAFKTQLFCLAFIFLRASLPRLRFDQLTQLCWQYLFPLVFTLALLATALPYAVTLHGLGLPFEGQGWRLWEPEYFPLCDEEKKICGNPRGIYAQLGLITLQTDPLVAVPLDQVAHWDAEPLFLPEEAQKQMEAAAAHVAKTSVLPHHEMPQLAGSPSAPRSRVPGPRGKP